MRQKQRCYKELFSPALWLVELYKTLEHWTLVVLLRASYLHGCTCHLSCVLSLSKSKYYGRL
jgi:hypothetical protein